MSRVLIVEDNASLAFAVRRTLEAAGYEVEAVTDALGAQAALARGEPLLIVLDLMLPGASGFDVLRDLRAAGLATPVLILSARSGELDKLKGFRLGADDYVVKPVGVLELVARVEAILRRTHGPTRAAPPGDDRAARVRFGDVTVDPARHMVEKRGAPVELAPKEFELLLRLLGGDGAVVDRATLLTQVWGYKRPVPTRTVDTHVANLRAKIEDDPARPRHILTVRKLGYRLQR